MASSVKINKNFLDSIDEYGELLSKASVWDNDYKNIFGQVKNSQDNFIYEFYCYITLVADLSLNYRIQYDPGSGSHRNCFPKGPAAKRDRPKFIVFEKDTVTPICQVCAGTEISTNFSSRAPSPDISFQKGDASDSPSYDDLIFVVDAKYNIPTSKKSKLSLNQLYYFAGMIKDLCISNANSKVVLKFSPKLSFINHNCLLTNEDGCSDDTNYISSHGLKLVCFFDWSLQRVVCY